MPVLTESEDEDPDTTKKKAKPEKHHSGVRYKLMKYVCGVDRNHPVKKLTKEEKIAQRIAISNISEDPKWKKFMNIQAIICAAIAVFIHAFFG